MGRIVLDTSATIDDLLEIMRKRRSCRLFEPDPVPEEMITNILEAGRWAPSGCSSEPWEFIVVRDAERRRRFSEIYSQQRKFSEERDAGPEGFPWPDLSYLFNVPVFIVVAGDRRLNRTYPMLYYRYDIYQQSMAACIQNMFLAAAAQGLGATWLSMGRHFEQELLALFEIPPGYRIETILAIGWPDLRREVRERRPLAEIVHYESFDPSRARSEAAASARVTATRGVRRLDREISGETPSTLGFGDKPLEKLGYTVESIEDRGKR
ncbi:MAG: nitroreductase family protein [Candidatus Tectomicrobia bacterium]|nr:nitroreductase family protein [Candidatus Tectomicrobia bacterium]